MKDPKRAPCDRYTIQSYRSAIAKACEKADRAEHTISSRTLIWISIRSRSPWVSVGSAPTKTLLWLMAVVAAFLGGERLGRQWQLREDVEAAKANVDRAIVRAAEMRAEERRLQASQAPR
jgi:hypothetical protein